MSRTRRETADDTAPIDISGDALKSEQAPEPTQGKAKTEDAAIAAHKAMHPGIYIA